MFFLQFKVLTNVPPICEIVHIQFPETDKSEKRSITSWPPARRSEPATPPVFSERLTREPQRDRSTRQERRFLRKLDRDKSTIQHSKATAKPVLLN